MLEIEVYHKRLDSNHVGLGQVEIQGFENIYAYVPCVIKKKSVLLEYGLKNNTLHVEIVPPWHQLYLKALPHTFMATFS